ncbi:MAG TPA: hypothetical protein VFL42_10445, partial [Terriglobales bacterium]|nr:hypothetical protein [Terriglobales bacterium]
EGGGGAKDQTPKLGVSLAPLTPEVARQFGLSGDEGVEGGEAQKVGLVEGMNKRKQREQRNHG